MLSGAMEIIAPAGAGNVSFYLPLPNYSRKMVDQNLRESNPSWVESCVASLQSVTRVSLFFVFNIYLFIYLAVQDFSYWDLYLWHANSELPCVEHRSLARDGNRVPYIERMESQPLEHKRSSQISLDLPRSPFRNEALIHPTIGNVVSYWLTIEAFLRNCS